MGDEKIKVVIVSGLSGAGKTVALRALEDSGYFCIDNLPVTLIEPFLSAIKTGGDVKRVGVGVDIREKEFLSDAYRIISDLKRDYVVEILFLEAEKEVMVRRYKETRRPHPMLSLTGEKSMDRAIEDEQAILKGIRDAADRIVDTSHYSPHELRHFILSTYGILTSAEGITLTLISFGFKFGVPMNLDMLFDVRFLSNPYFVPELKPFKGTDPVVSGYVLGQDETREFMCHLYSLFDFLVPRYLKEGRSYLVVGFGCTGGRHRSPAIAEEV
ncbi:MAG TPA: RNase adapter RapZ, partial [Dissulfurispiraceae bacterium]|nr:RNase adapter RapZ [Dissulfurispiraceae bacterium]